MYRKSGCIVKKKRFYKERLKFYIENEISIEENSIMYRKPGCIVKKKTPFLQGNTEILHRKQKVL